MKKFLTLPVLAAICSCISCNTENKSGPSPAAQKNLDAMHAITKTFETKDYSKLGDYIAVDAVDHAGESGDIKGLDSLKAAFTKMSDAMNMDKTEIIKELADDEYVMSWERSTGTYKKDDGTGHKAGDKFDMKAIEVAKFKDGKATEHWTMMEPGELMKMMGGMQQPAMPAHVDSVKKS